MQKYANLTNIFPQCFFFEADTNYTPCLDLDNQRVYG